MQNKITKDEGLTSSPNDSNAPVGCCTLSLIDKLKIIDADYEARGWNEEYKIRKLLSEMIKEYDDTMRDATDIKTLLKEMKIFFQITWDRFIESDGQYEIYGWLQKESGKRDFVLLQLYFEDGKIKGGFSTSSAKYSEKIHEFLYNTKAGHNKCQRIETLLVV